ncbi:ATP-binding protein [Planococcus sp. SIMBA_160]
MEVSDDGAGMRREKVESVLDVNRQGEHGIGLINTDKRLRQMYGRGLEISSAEGIGTPVRFVVPRSGT